MVFSCHVTENCPSGTFEKSQSFYFWEKWEWEEEAEAFRCWSSWTGCSWVSWADGNYICTPMMMNTLWREQHTWRKLQLRVFIWNFFKLRIYYYMRNKVVTWFSLGNMRKHETIFWNCFSSQTSCYVTNLGGNKCEQNTQVSLGKCTLVDLDLINDDMSDGMGSDVFLREECAS